MILILLICALVAAVPFLVQRIRQERAKERLAAQFRASLQNIAHALRVGVGLSQALEYAAKEGAEPLSGEWRTVLQAVRIGQPLGEALQDFAQRIALKEARWFTTAVQITQFSGGSLSDVLETLAETLQAQEALRQKVGALTAQGKASGILLSLLPYALLGALGVVAPEMAAPFFTTWVGQAVLAGVTLSLATGGLVIKKIVTIPVD
jgi:tight adherence protein B